MTNQGKLLTEHKICCLYRAYLGLTLVKMSRVNKALNMQSRTNQIYSFGEQIFTTAPTASKRMLDSVMVDTDSKLIILFRKSKSVTLRKTSYLICAF